MNLPSLNNTNFNIEERILEKKQKIGLAAPYLSFKIISKVCEYIENHKELLLKNTPSITSFQDYSIYVTKNDPKKESTLYVLPREKNCILGKGSHKTIYLGFNYLNGKTIAHYYFNETTFSKKKTVKKLSHSADNFSDKIKLKRMLTITELNILNIFRINKSHPQHYSQGILKLIEDDIFNEQIIMVFKWYRLGTLEHVLNTEKVSGTNLLSFDQKIKIAHDLALGLLNTHLKGVIHNDIKESNILVTHKSKNRNLLKAVISDFGLAVHIKDSTYEYGGSPVYYSPEKILHINSGYTGVITCEEGMYSDMWALGVVFYRLFLGKDCPSKSGIDAIGGNNLRLHPHESAKTLRKGMEKIFTEPHPKTIENVIWRMLRPDGINRINPIELLSNLDFFLPKRIVTRSVIPPISIPKNIDNSDSLETPDSADTSSGDSFRDNSKSGSVTNTPINVRKNRTFRSKSLLQ